MLALNSESSYKANFVSKRAVFAFYSVSVKKNVLNRWQKSRIGWSEGENALGWAAL